MITPRICLDAGHGPRARSTYKNPVATDPEHALNWAMVQKIVRLFGDTHHVTQTRQDYFESPSPQERANIANGAEVDLFISIHFNAFKRPGACGPEVYYYRNSVTSRHISGGMADRITQETGRSCRVKAGGFKVLRVTHMPALLIEGAYMTNPDDRRDLETPDYPHKLAVGILRGIAECLKTLGRLPT